MEVTRDNFASLLPEIQESITNSLFVSIDQEFTGVKAYPDIVPPALINPSEHYQKLRLGSIDFLLLQFGLAIFNYNEEEDKYTYKVFSFYLFPKPYNFGRGFQELWFKAQATSVDMLADNDFDFNKVFKKGVPFINHAQETYIREGLEDLRRKRAVDSMDYNRPEDNFQVPEMYQKTIQTLGNILESFIANNESTKNISMTSNSTHESKFIFHLIRRRYSSPETRINMELVDNSRYVLILRGQITEQDRIEEENRKVKEEDDLLHEAIGFRHIIDTIIKTKKPIVGHNMLLDLLHMMKRFYKPLPEDYLDFKAMLHYAFPTIIDTKHLCSREELRDRFPSSTLSFVYQALLQDPFQMIKTEAEPGRGYDLDNVKAHDAGYDALITGIIYQTLVNYLGSIQSPPVSPILPDNSLLLNYTNIIYLYMVQSYLNIVGPEPIVDRSHVFFITFPKQWQPYQVTPLFKPYGRVHIRKVNDYCAMITLLDKEFSATAKADLVTNRNSRDYLTSGYRVTPFEEFAALGGSRLLQSRRRAFNPRFFEPRSSSRRRRF